jgi:hypothetical protein
VQKQIRSGAETAMDVVHHPWGCTGDAVIPQEGNELLR